MNDNSIVPSDNDFGHYFEQAREICRRVRHKTHLSDDEIIILAVVAAQLALSRYVEPGPRNADDTLDKILAILDHNEVVAALSSKMDSLLRGQKTITRLDAPGMTAVPSPLLKDPEEPVGE